MTGVTYGQLIKQNSIFETDNCSEEIYKRNESLIRSS